jgi:hypothetical protein
MSDLPPKEYGLGGRNYAKARDARDKADEAVTWQDANSEPPVGGTRIFPPGDPRPLGSRRRELAAKDREIAALRETLTRISTAARYDKSLGPPNPLVLDFIVAQVDATLGRGHS